MKDAEYFESIIDDLTELEMESLLEVCNQKLMRDKMGNLREKIFREDDLGAMEDLQDEVSQLESKNEKLETRLERAKQLAGDAISYIEDIEKL